MFCSLATCTWTPEMTAAATAVTADANASQVAARRSFFRDTAKS
jgi:hypothetical protein